MKTSMSVGLPELLAPAGDEEALRAAVCAGADAVYLGFQAFSARASAANFDGEQLAQAVRYAHLHHVRVYVTVNTLVKEHELEALYNALAIPSRAAGRTRSSVRIWAWRAMDVENFSHSGHSCQQPR